MPESVWEEDISILSVCVCVFQSTGEKGDLSCGWAFLKLTDDTGNPLPNR